jgi:hypothetical protein
MEQWINGVKEGALNINVNGWVEMTIGEMEHQSIFL